jgi:hypothetical protein
MDNIAEITQQVHKIQSLYIAEGSEMEINISSELRKAIDIRCNEIFSGRICQLWIDLALLRLPNVFDAAYKQVSILLRNDVWPRFCAQEQSLMSRYAEESGRPPRAYHTSRRRAIFSPKKTAVELYQSWADFMKLWVRHITSNPAMES